MFVNDIFIGIILSYLKEGIRAYWWAILIFLILAGYISKTAFEVKFDTWRLKRIKEEMEKVRTTSNPTPARKP